MKQQAQSPRPLLIPSKRSSKVSPRARLTAGSQVSPADLHSSPATIARKTASFRGLAAARLAPLTATTAVNGPGFAMRRVDDSKSGPDLDSTIRWRNLERSTWRSEESNGSHAHQSAREKGEGNERRRVAGAAGRGTARNLAQLQRAQQAQPQLSAPARRRVASELARPKRDEAAWSSGAVCGSRSPSGRRRT